MSVIARTAAIGRSAEELQWDLNYLLQLWQAVDGAAKDSEKKPFLIYLESSLVIRAIRDYFQPDIGEILIDTQEIYDQAVAFMQTVMPANVGKVKLYRDDVPLFSRFQVEHQIESAYGRHVNLPSGGAIVIDHTEALVSIDVNSARATKGHDIEETAYRTNLEAAEEVARQLRLRDLGGLIVVDFIDMESQKNQRDVENVFRDSLRHDRARVQIGKISRFGLMELSRQRLQPSLEETAHISCPRCGGTGFIRGTESTALHVLRIIQEEAMKENTGAVHAQVPVDVASFLLNEKRGEIQKLEARIKVNIVLVPNPHLETPHYKVQRLKHDELNQMEHVPTSYEMVAQPEDPQAPGKEAEAKKERPQAAVQGIVPDQPAPIVPEPAPRTEVSRGSVATTAPAPAMQVQEPARSGFLGRLFGWLKTEKSAEQPAANEPAMRPARPPREDRPRDENRNRHERGRDDRGGRGGRDGRGGRGGRGGRDGRDGRSEQQRDGRGGRDQQPRRDQRPQQPQQQQAHPDRPQGERQQAEMPQQGELTQAERPNGDRPQGERRPDQRPPRPPQQQRPQGEQQGQNNGQNNGQRPPQQDGEEPRRGRRNRGGRGGGDRADRPQGERGDRPQGERRPEQQHSRAQRPDQSVYAQQLEEHRLKQQREAEMAHETETPARHESALAPQVEETIRAEAPREEAPREAEAPRVEAPRAEAPRVEAPRQEAPRVEAAQQNVPRVDPKEILSTAGLQMVETNASKARQPEPEPEQVQLGRPRREKTASQAASDELVQVETRNK